MTSAFDTHGSWTRFTIALVGADGKQTHEGWDIVEQNAEHKIIRVLTFWGPLPGLTVQETCAAIPRNST